jgi:hypothetical protein
MVAITGVTRLRRPFCTVTMKADMEGRRVHEVFANFQTSTSKPERVEKNGNQLSQRGGGSKFGTRKFSLIARNHSK